MKLTSASGIDFYIADAPPFEKQRGQIVFEEVVKQNIYNLDLLPKDIQRAIDLGSNVGIVSRLFCLAFPKATIHAFDVNEHDIEETSMLNLKGLNCIQHWHGVFGFLGESGHEKEAGKLPNKTSISIGEAWNLTGFDSADFLKIDVEGSETNILLDMQARGILDKIDYIAGEYHFSLAQNTVEQVLPKTHTLYIRQRSKPGDDFFACPRDLTFDFRFTASNGWKKIT